MSDSEKGGMLMRYAGIAGATIGVLAAGAAAGILAERKLVARKRAAAAQPFGSVRGHPAHRGRRGRARAVRRGRRTGPTRGDRPVTVVFVHGYALNLDCWHFQRLAMRAEHRLVLYDQRSHGRSARSPQRALHDRLPRS